MITQSGHLEEANHHQLFASPLRNRLLLLTTAAGHLHHDKSNGHQWAEEVGVPKLADPTGERIEQSAESWTMKTTGSRYHEDYPRRSAGKGDHQMVMETLPTSERTFRVDYQTTTGSQCPHAYCNHSARTRQEQF